MKIITVASGKGGVGKTILTANLGLALASSGQRVVLFDADLGLANLDAVLRLKTDITVQHVLEGIVRMPEAAVQGPAGIRVVAGSSGISAMLRLSRKRLEALLSQVKELEDSTDILIFDAASGADARVMTVLKMADQAILITTPDPVSIVDCYSTAKVLFRHKRDAIVSIVANQVKDDDQARRSFDAIESAARTFLHKQVSYLGCVREDRAAAEIARTRRPFVLDAPDLPASNDIRALAVALVKGLSASEGRIEDTDYNNDSKAA